METKKIYLNQYLLSLQLLQILYQHFEALKQEISTLIIEYLKFIQLHEKFD